MQTQNNFLSYMIDLCFHDHKLAIEIDEMETVTELLTMK